MTDTTSDLGPDEKVCPFCAETVKAAAVKCRFCQSDLPMDESPEPEQEWTAPADFEEPAPASFPQPADEDSDDAPVARPGPTGSWSSGVRWITVLTVLCVLLAGGLAFLVQRAYYPELDTEPNGQITANSFRNWAMTAASSAAA
jgi:hypothetical protein